MGSQKTYLSAFVRGVTAALVAVGVFASPTQAEVGRHVVTGTWRGSAVEVGPPGSVIHRFPLTLRMVRTRRGFEVQGLHTTGLDQCALPGTATSTDAHIRIVVVRMPIAPNGQVSGEVQDEDSSVRGRLLSARRMRGSIAVWNVSLNCADFRMTFTAVAPR